MHAFAQECRQAAPAGSINGAIVADAHTEHSVLLIASVLALWMFVAVMILVPSGCAPRR